MPRSIVCRHPIGDRLEEGIRLANKAAHYASIAGDLFARAEAGEAEHLARTAVDMADEARRQAEDVRSSEGAGPPPKRRRRNRKSAP